MSATSLDVSTFQLPNSRYDGGTYHRVNTSLGYNYGIAKTIRTLSSNNITPGQDVSGLLYTPELTPNSDCYNASAPYIPANVTTQSDLPNVNYDLVALAPWTSPQCVQTYLEAARMVDTVQGFMFFLPDDDGTAIPPGVNSQQWLLGDGGSWKRQNEYPVYAIPGAYARILLATSALYSRNMSDVPFGQELSEIYDPHDYIRLFVDIDTAGNRSSLPSLWIFLLIVLGILLAVIGLTSCTMHWLQRRRRRDLQNRVANGQVDLEALGIKKLTVPQDVLDEMPLYTYGTRAPAPPTATEDAAAADKLASAESSRPSSPSPNARPTPALNRSTSYRPSALQQPTCAICLDDFVPASEESEGTTVRELPCRHIYHPECIDTFLKDSSSLCPVCKRTALPKGYCPRVVTNAMVRRERLARRVGRIRERRATRDPSFTEQGPHELNDDTVPPLNNSIGHRIRTSTRAFSGLRPGRRISSAPTPSSSQPMTELTPPAPALVRSNTDTSRRQLQPPRVQPPSNPTRREWARQRAVAMLWRSAATEPDPLLDEDARTTPRWRKALRGVFPGR